MWTELLFVTLAAWWFWEGVRFLCDELVPQPYLGWTVASNPLIALLVPLVALWPHVVQAMACAAMVAVCHALFDKFRGTVGAGFQFRRPRGGGLPPIP